MYPNCSPTFTDLNRNYQIPAACENVQCGQIQIWAGLSYIVWLYERKVQPTCLLHTLCNIHNCKMSHFISQVAHSYSSCCRCDGHVRGMQPMLQLYGNQDHQQRGIRPLSSPGAGSAPATGWWREGGGQEGEEVRMRLVQGHPGNLKVGWGFERSQSPRDINSHAKRKEEPYENLPSSLLVKVCNHLGSFTSGKPINILTSTYCTRSKLNLQGR